MWQGIKGNFQQDTFLGYLAIVRIMMSIQFFEAAFYPPFFSRLGLCHIPCFHYVLPSFSPEALRYLIIRKLYFTVTDLARLRGRSGSLPRLTAAW